MKSKGKPRRRRAGAAKPKVKSKPLAVRKAPQNERSKVRDLEQRLAESLERETATSEILGVISSSPTDIQPVFDTIMRSAVRLSGARFGAVYRFDGEMVHFVGEHGSDDAALESYRRMFPMRPDRGVLGARSILDRAVVHVPDVFQDPEFLGKDIARASGWNSAIAVPMLREGTPIGAIVISKAERGPFSDGQITLLKTFADQAVIAIENVRLFKELEARNRDVTEALEQQTATTDILRVIPQSPTDVQPVFDMIAESAARLCEAQYCFVYRFEGQLLHFVAHHGLTAEVLEINRRAYPAPPGRRSVAARAVLERSVVQIPDVNADPDYALRAMAAAGGYRSAAAVPILRDGLPIGSIAVTRAQAGLLPDRQIDLLKTFADQAVIAIENVRLFNETKQALEQQTATSEILGVINQSPTDVQPVFDTIAARAKRLCDALECAVFRFDGELIHLVAQADTDAAWANALRSAFPRPPGRGSITARAIQTRSLVHIPDVQADPEFDLTEAARISSIRSVLTVPMIREGEVIGAITVDRRDPKPFLDKQIGLVKTFADQAVIAIENVRLFTELQSRNSELTESLEQQTATSEVLQVISRSPSDVEPTFEVIAVSAARLCEAVEGTVFRFDGALIHIAAHCGGVPDQRRPQAGLSDPARARKRYGARHPDASSGSRAGPRCGS
jgi:two-component system, NtrC family, sensor kinase